MMSLQRAVLIFAIFLCCFRSCLCTNCEYFPYHPSCRGTMKRVFNSAELSSSYPESRHMHSNSHNACTSSDCKAKIKYLFSLLNDNVNRQVQVNNQRQNNPYDDYETSVKKELRSEQQSRNNFGMRNMARDYID